MNNIDLETSSTNKSSVRKTLVIDTNVAIDDPDCLYKFGDNNVVIPLTVYEELDAIKNESGTERGFLARQFLKNLITIQQDAINNQNGCSGNSFIKGININNTTIYLNVDDIKPDENFYFDISHNDNKIVCCAYNLNKTIDNVVMVSNDVSVRFTATELKLNAQQYKANRIDKKELYKGYREIKASSDFINTFYSKKKVENTFDLYPNEFVIFIDESNSSKKAIGRYKVNSVVSNGDSFGYIHLLDESIYPQSDLESSPKVIRPKNLGQKMLYDLLQDDNIKIITVTGMPGAGKTLLPVADAFEKVAEDKYKKFLYCKSVIPTDKSEEIGYFKGDMIDKLSHHLQGLYSSIEFLYENDIYSTKHKIDLNNLVEKLITSNTLELKPLATIRGASVQNRYILFDEAQNVNSYMMKAIITRVCDNCKLVIAGDLNQIDTKHLHKYNNGLAHLIAKGKAEPYVAHISLDINGKSARGDIATFGNKL